MSYIGPSPRGGTPAAGPNPAPPLPFLFRDQWQVDPGPHCLSTPAADLLQGFTGSGKPDMVCSMKYYAVATGRTTGVFTSWPEAKAQVDGFPGAVFKSFKPGNRPNPF